MSIYDEIEARADQQEESRRKRILAIGVRLWLIRPPPPPSMASYEQIDGVVSASFEDGALKLTVGTDIAALDEGGITDAALRFMDHTGTLDYRVMELRDTAGTLVARAWLGKGVVALALLGGITGGVVCAAVIGVAMPNLLRLFAREPQVAAGPVSLAATDMVTLLIYFSLARWLLS